MHLMTSILSSDTLEESISFILLKGKLVGCSIDLHSETCVELGIKAERLSPSAISRL